MISIASLWLPILVSVVAVFVASSIIHMVLTYHNSDFGKLPAEPEIMEALGKHGIAPGDYFMPHGEGAAAMKDPEFIEKMTRGPVALMTFVKSGPPAMGKSLVQWFVFCLLVLHSL